MKIYVASSWRNILQPGVVGVLRSHGHEVYDFRKPRHENTGFHWSEIDPDWKEWIPGTYLKGLSHPLAEKGYALDREAMEWADTFVGVMPFGVSASLEMGWAAGQGKLTVLLITKCMEPELMVKMFDHICCNTMELVGILHEHEMAKYDGKIFIAGKWIDDDPNDESNKE